MTSPQVEDGYTRIANGLLDKWMCSVNLPEAVRILFCVIRLTYGYGRKTASISYDQFQNNTGMEKSNIHRGIKKAHSLGLIKIRKNPRGKPKYIYEVNKQIDPIYLSKRITLSNRISKPLSKWISSTYPNGQVATSSKENIEKKNRKEREPLPEWLDKNLWKEFKTHRVKIKSPMTPYAEKLAFTKLQKLCNGDISLHRDLIKQSIVNGWKGFFPLKDQTPEDEQATEEDYRRWNQEFSKKNSPN